MKRECRSIPRLPSEPSAPQVSASRSAPRVMGTPQAQLLRLPLEQLLSGRRVGLAMEPLNQQWSSLAAQLGVLLGGGGAGDPPPRPPAIANLFIARDDARNYIVLGDPAARLRTESMN